MHLHAFLITAALLSVSTDDAPATKQTLLREKLDQSIAAADRELDGVLGVAILDLTSGQLIARHADEVFPVASSIKIAVLAELLRRNTNLDELYTLRPEDVVGGSGIVKHLSPGATRLTFRDLATLMIVESDNSATNVLIDRVEMDNVNALMSRARLEQTRLRRRMMNTKAAAEGRENTSTPQEMAQLLAKIYNGEILSAPMREQFLELLALPKDGALNRGLPPGTRSATKSGELDGVRADCGIVFLKERPFTIAVPTTFARDGRQAEEAISAVAGAAFRYFARLARSSPYGRLIR